MAALDEERGLGSRAGVAWPLDAFLPFSDGTGGDGEPRAEWEVGREGCGERMGGSAGLGAGDLGDWTVTLGGDLVGDLGGEKAIMEDGLGLVFRGIRSEPPRDTAGPARL